MTKGSIRNFLVNYGLSNDDYRKIRSNIVDTNIKNMTIASIVFSLYSLIMLVVGIANLNMGKILVYSICGSITLAMFLFTRFFSKKHDRMLKFFVYIFIIDIIILGILINTVIDPTHYAVAFIGFVILAPLLFSDRPYRIVSCVFVGVSSFCITAFFTKENGIWQTDITNTIIFSVISTVISIYLGKVKINGFWSAYQVSVLANTDLLTGLNNRNCYEIRLNEYSDKIKDNITCIYIDANELHSINNNLGHEFGDQMLINIANTLTEKVGHDDVYRIGGDEFVCFAIDRNLNDIMSISRDISSKIDSLGYHIAIGISSHEKKNLDLKELIKETEMIMYAEKKKYYDNLNKEVRNNYQNA